MIALKTLLFLECVFGFVLGARTLYRMCSEQCVEISDFAIVFSSLLLMFSSGFIIYQFIIEL